MESEIEIASAKYLEAIEDDVRKTSPFHIGQLVDCRIGELPAIVGRVAGVENDKYLGWLIDTEVMFSDGMAIYRLNSERLSPHVGFIGKAVK